MLMNSKNTSYTYCCILHVGSCWKDTIRPWETSPSACVRERNGLCYNDVMLTYTETPNSWKQPGLHTSTHFDLPTALSPRQMIFTCSSASYFFWSSSGMPPASPAISSLWNLLPLGLEWLYYPTCLLMSWMSWTPTWRPLMTIADVS